MASPERLTREQRQQRDHEALRLFLAGETYRQIGATIGLRSASGVHRIVQRELAAAAGRRGLLTDEAFAIHQERLERLLCAHWELALDASNPNSHRSALICQRILAQQSRIYGLAESMTLPPPTQTGPEHDDDDIGGTVDELARLRAARGLP